MAKIMKNGIEYGSSIPPLGEGLTVNQSTGEIELTTASDEDITKLINNITFDNTPVAP